jgi:hypothetical protein
MHTNNPLPQPGRGRRTYSVEFKTQLVAACRIPAMALAQQMLAWCPMDNIGVRFLLGDIALLQGDHRAALQEYLKGAPNSPAHWYRMVRYADDFVVLCQNASQAQQALQEVKAWVEENGLELHPDKTHVGDCRIRGQGFEFLGYRFESGKHSTG